MSDPLTYNLYGTTIPVFRSCAASAISVLTTAQNELANATKGTLPSEQDLLDAQFGSMYPFRMQPILLSKFQVVALEYLKLHGSTPIPALDAEFKSFNDIIDFFKQLQAVFDAVDEKAMNEAAGKSVDVPFKSGKVLRMTSLADYYHSFVVPNSYFHLNAMYMLLRSKGFELGKGVYVGAWMSETSKADWAPLKG